MVSMAAHCEPVSLISCAAPRLKPCEEYFSACGKRRWASIALSVSFTFCDVDVGGSFSPGRTLWAMHGQMACAGHIRLAVCDGGPQKQGRDMMHPFGRCFLGISRKTRRWLGGPPLRAIKAWSLIGGKAARSSFLKARREGIASDGTLNAKRQEMYASCANGPVLVSRWRIWAIADLRIKSVKTNSPLASSLSDAIMFFTDGVSHASEFSRKKKALRTYPT